MNLNLSIILRSPVETDTTDSGIREYIGGPRTKSRPVRKYPDTESPDGFFRFSFFFEVGYFNVRQPEPVPLLYAAHTYGTRVIFFLIPKRHLAHGFAEYFFFVFAISRLVDDKRSARDFPSRAIPARYLYESVFFASTIISLIQSRPFFPFRVSSLP